MTRMDLCKGNIYINEFPFIYQKKKEKKKRVDTTLPYIQAFNSSGHKDSIRSLG